MYRKEHRIPLKDFVVEDLRILIGQKFSFDYLKKDLFAERMYYPGDLLNNALSVEAGFWLQNEELKREMDQLLMNAPHLPRKLGHAVQKCKSIWSKYMHIVFLKWAEERKSQLDMLKINTDEVNIAENNANPSVTVDYSSETCIGRVSVWETGLIDMEVLDINTGKRLCFEHHQLKDNIEFDKLCKNFFATLKKRP